MLFNVRSGRSQMYFCTRQDDIALFAESKQRGDEIRCVAIAMCVYGMMEWISLRSPNVDKQEHMFWLLKYII